MTQQELPRPPIHDESISYQWREWLRRLYIRAAEAGQIFFTSLDFTGSNLTDLETRNHNDLQSFQGGTTDEYYHLTVAETVQFDTLTDGSNADSLHEHSTLDVDTILLTPDDDLVTDGNGNILVEFE